MKGGWGINKFPTLKSRIPTLKSRIPTLKSSASMFLNVCGGMLLIHLLIWILGILAH